MKSNLKTDAYQRSRAHSPRLTTIRNDPLRTRPLLEQLEDRNLMAAGMLDTSFDGDGFAQTAIGGGNDRAAAVAVQSDGKSVVGGSVVQADGTYAFAIARYNVNGSLDASFGSGGKSIISFATSHNAVVNAIAIQGDGKIIAVGSDTMGGSPASFNVALTRLNSNGSLDTTFGAKVKNSATGKLLTPVPYPTGSAMGAAVAVQGDGKIVVGGSARPSGFGTGATADFAIYRFTATGQVDKTFNRGVPVFTDFGGQDDRVYGLKIQPDGKIIAVGTAPVPSASEGTFDNTAIARYNTNGTLDAAFGTGGKATFDLAGGNKNDSAESVVLQPLPGGSFRIVTTGYAEIPDPSSPYGRSPIMTVAGFTPSGTLDPTFANGGVVKTEAPPLTSGNEQVRSWWGDSLALQSDGKIVVNASAAIMNYPERGLFGLARYTANGVLDSTFGNNGSTLIDQLEGNPIAGGGVDLALDASDRAVIAGFINTDPASSTGLDFLVARFTSDSGSSSAITAADEAMMLFLMESPTVGGKKK